MYAIKRYIFQYAQQYNHLPASLSELPPMPGYETGEFTSTDDAWGRAFDYGVDPSGIVTLRSLGADKRVGGDGDNRDIIGKFATRDPEGHWKNELGEWTVNPGKP